MAERKNPHAVALGREGGKVRTRKGFAVLTKAERSERAREGAAARWAKAKKKGSKNA
jgi:hypothetical protein